MSFGLIGEVLAIGITLKALKNINGEEHKLEKVHTSKSNADEHAKRLRKSGKRARVVKGKDKNGKPIYGVYTRVKKKKVKK
jgi:hypothetical protein